MLTTTAGSPPISARRKTFRSCPPFSNSIRRDPAIERAARKAERLGRLTHVSAVPIERFPDEQPLDVFEGQIFELGRRGRRCPQREIRRARSEEHTSELQSQS